MWVAVTRWCTRWRWRTQARLVVGVVGVWQQRVEEFWRTPNGEAGLTKLVNRVSDADVYRRRHWKVLHGKKRGCRATGILGRSESPMMNPPDWSRQRPSFGSRLHTRTLFNRSGRIIYFKQLRPLGQGVVQNPSTLLPWVQTCNSYFGVTSYTVPKLPRLVWQ